MNESDQTLTRYLLGELSEEERTALEEKYFVDSVVFNQLTRVENDLIDDYARGRLPSALRQRFEQAYLAHPKRLSRLEFGEAFVARLDKEKPHAAIVAPSDSWWTATLAGFRNRPAAAFSIAFVVVLITSVAFWFAVTTTRLRRELTDTQAARAAQQQRERDLQRQIAEERARTDQLANELGRLQAQQVPTPKPPNRVAPTIASLILTITGVRGSETGAPAKLVIQAGAEKAQFQLNLRDSEYRSYEAVLRSAGGQEVFTQSGLRARSKTHPSLLFMIPAHKLSEGDYILTLKGLTPSGDVEDVSKSLFRVERK